MPPEPVVDVVIVSYECLPHLRECLDSLRAAPPAGLGAIVVVDNASRDGTAAAVRDEFPAVSLVAMPENAGFAAATNTGIARTRGRYILVLNPDTVVPAGAVDALVRVLDEHPEVGVCGPRLLRPDGTFDHAARRAFPTVTSALGHFSGLGRLRRAPARLAAYRAPEVESGPVDAVNGACMLVRRATLEATGGFDEGYWMYMEDLDLCYRFAQAGWTTWYEPSVVVRHVKHGSAGAVRSVRLELAFHRGMARFYRVHYAPGRPRVLNGLVYAGIRVKLLAWLAAGVVRRLARR
ncbi:MAG TPA: glycosyltransferase family 2 protein [Gaiellaceae bacterium]|nr:glycosyltransferase family 2 protein [Gaiellaceae bacterium]